MEREADSWDRKRSRKAREKRHDHEKVGRSFVAELGQ